MNAESEAEPKSPGEIQGCHAVTRRGMNDEVVLDVVEPKQGGEDDGFHYDHAVPDPSALTVRQKTPGVILPSKRPREVEEAVAVEQWMEDVIAERKAKQIFQDAQKEWNTARKKEQASSAKLFSVLEEKERLEEEEGRRKRQC